MLPLVGFRGARESARTWPQGSVVAVSARGSGVFRSCNQALLVSDRDNLPDEPGPRGHEACFDLCPLRWIRTGSITRGRPMRPTTCAVPLPCASVSDGGLPG